MIAPVRPSLRRKAMRNIAGAERPGPRPVDADEGLPLLWMEVSAGPQDYFAGVEGRSRASIAISKEEAESSSAVGSLTGSEGAIFGRSPVEVNSS